MPRCEARHPARGAYRSLKIRRGLARLGSERRAGWADRSRRPSSATRPSFEDNGWVVEAFQAAWSAVVHSREAAECEELQRPGRGRGPRSPRRRVARGIISPRAAAITPTRSLRSPAPCSPPPTARLGAAQWRRVLHGWPGLPSGIWWSWRLHRRGDERPAGRWPRGWTTPRPRPTTGCGRTPSDDGVLIGGVRGLDELPVSGSTRSSPYAGSAPPRCPSGTRPPAYYVHRWVDDTDPRLDNPNLPFVLDDAALGLRREQKTVYVHGVTAHRDAAAVAARYGSLVGAFQEFGGLLSTR